MSNMSKTIAILGVVAGLGAAALPLSTYAAEVVWGSQAENNEAWANKTMGGTDKTKLGEDSFVSTDTTIHLSIEDKLSIATTMDDVELTSTDDIDFSAANALSVTVISKNAGGYQLTMFGNASTDTEGVTVKTKNALTNATGDEFLALNAAATSLSEGTWGFKLTTQQQGADTATDVDDGKWQVVANAAANGVIMSSTTATKAEGDVAGITFGARAAANQAAGTYKGRVTFTATNQAKTGTGD